MHRALVLSGAFLVSSFQPICADSYVVDTEADVMATGCSDIVVGDCSLRGAIQRANQNPGLDVITFGFGVADVALGIVGSYEDDNQQGDLDILEEVVINGGDVVTIDGSLIGDRVFDVMTSTTVEPTILQGLTVTGGAAPSGDSLFDGGGVRCDSSRLHLEAVVLAGNGPVRNGGGVFALSCDLSVVTSTLDHNTATGLGGGLHFESGSDLSIAHVAFVANVASSGGGLQVHSASATVENTTFSGNDADNDGSALQVAFGELELGFVTVVGGTGNNTLSNAASVVSTVANSVIVGTCQGTFTTEGGNLEAPGDTCGLDPLVDQFSVADALLQPLGFYGGRTPSHAPRWDSPAVDDPLGVIADCPTVDQRLQPRPVDGNGDSIVGCDAGAVEADELIFADGFESGDTLAWGVASQ